MSYSPLLRGSDERRWLAMFCIESFLWIYIRFGVLILSPLLMLNSTLLCHFRSLFSWFWSSSIWSCFLGDLFERITHEFMETFSLVIFALQTPWITVSWEFLGSTWLLCVHSQDLWFCIIEFAWGLDLLDMACPWGNSTLPKITSQSIAWVVEIDWSEVGVLGRGWFYSSVSRALTIVVVDH